MTVLQLELPAEVYQRLRQEAERVGKPVETLAQEWLLERVRPASLIERERTREVLQAAGLLTELTPEEKAVADHCSVTLEEVQAMFEGMSGPPVSEIVIEQRGPKV